MQKYFFDDLELDLANMTLPELKNTRESLREILSSIDHQIFTRQMENHKFGASLDEDSPSRGDPRVSSR